jgi:hypothetical protein
VSSTKSALAKDEVLQRLCKLLWEVHQVKGSDDEACDCFCGHNRHYIDMGWKWRNDGQSLEWLEATVRVFTLGKDSQKNG